MSEPSGGKSVHALLARQLARAGIADRSLPPALDVWSEFLAAVNRAYHDAEHDRYLLERALDLSSEEMQRLYARVEEERSRLEKELEIAMVLQTSILPRERGLFGIEVAAKMVPATRVGGDYYDVLPSDQGCWIGVGDVSGHGLRAAMVMLMVQAMIAALVVDRPRSSPGELLSTMNRALWENVRGRLAIDEHVTLTLLFCAAGGQISFAGAHEEMLLCRANGGRCEQVPTPGTWLGAVRDIEAATVNSRLSLAKGDLLVLYTDGLTEAVNGAKEQFGLERLSVAIERHREQPLKEILEASLATVRDWSAHQEDDRTMLLLRYT